MPGTVEVVRAGRARRRAGAGRRGRRGRRRLAPAGRPLRAQDLGLLAAAGVIRRSRCTPRPRVAHPLHRRRGRAAATGDAAAGPGARRDGRRAGRAGHRRRRRARAAGHRPGRRGGARPALAGGAGRAATWSSSRAGSSVGARDETAGAVARLGRPASVATAWPIRPGKPTLLAECDGVPVIGLPGNPLSALVVFRLVGLPVVRLVGGCLSAAARAGTRARLAPRGAVASPGGWTSCRSAMSRRGGRAGVRALGAAVGADLGATATWSCPRPPPGSPRAARST